MTTRIISFLGCDLASGHEVSLIRHVAQRQGLDRVSIVFVGTSRVAHRWFGPDAGMWRVLDGADIQIAAGLVEISSDRASAFQTIRGLFRSGPMALSAPSWPDSKEGAPPSEILVDIANADPMQAFVVGAVMDTLRSNVPTHVLRPEDIQPSASAVTPLREVPSSDTCSTTPSVVE